MSAKNRKLQVFVSSTFEDLQEERQVAVAAILNAGHIPAGMELFAAGDQSQMQVIRDWIQESDVYMLILGGRYGSIEPESGKSYTQLEYEYAVEIGKPHFAVVISEKGEDLKVKKQGKKVLERDHSEKYNEFKKLVTTSKMVKFWDDPNGIELAIFKSLSEFNKREELIGWVRGDQVIDSGALAEELARLGKENSELRHDLERLRLLVDEAQSEISFEELYSSLRAVRIPTQEVSQYLSMNGKVQLNLSDTQKATIDGNQVLKYVQDRINGYYGVYPYEIQGFYNVLYHNGLIKFVQSPSSKVNCAAEFTSFGKKYLSELEKKISQ